MGLERGCMRVPLKSSIRVTRKVTTRLSDSSTASETRGFLYGIYIIGALIITLYCLRGSLL